MTSLELWQVDAFSSVPYRGNPAAVVWDADTLTSAQMQTIAQEMNLSETVFMLAPQSGGHYRVRIFTPRSELPFAGHPTLAACWSWLERHPECSSTVIVQECAAGEVRLEREEAGLMMTQMPPQFWPMPLEREQLAALIGCAPSDLLDLPAEISSTGAKWLVYGLHSLEAMQGLRPDQGGIERVSREHSFTGITVFTLEGEAAQVRLRTFAPAHGISEDPVCGSGNGSVAAYLARHGLNGGPQLDYTAEQGVEMGRAGYVRVHTRQLEDGTLSVQVGGQCVKVLEGRLFI